MAKYGLWIMCVLLVVLSALTALAETGQDAVTPDSSTITAKDELAKPSEPGKPYTSVIIDTSGLNLKRCMSPKIRQVDGTEVWGTVKVNYDFLEEHGLVAYAASIDDAKKSNRCGSNPMVVKALKITDNKQATDPIIAAEDAKLLLEENAKGKFLDKFDVIFVQCAQCAQQVAVQSTQK